MWWKVGQNRIRHQMVCSWNFIWWRIKRYSSRITANNDSNLLSISAEPLSTSKIGVFVDHLFQKAGPVSSFRFPIMGTKIWLLIDGTTTENRRRKAKKRINLAAIIEEWDVNRSCSSFTSYHPIRASSCRCIHLQYFSEFHQIGILQARFRRGCLAQYIQR